MTAEEFCLKSINTTIYYFLKNLIEEDCEVAWVNFEGSFESIQEVLKHVFQLEIPI